MSAGTVYRISGDCTLLDLAEEAQGRAERLAAVMAHVAAHMQPADPGAEAVGAYAAAAAELTALLVALVARMTQEQQQ